ncbi:hypothetical protein ACFL13_03220 [Patescibacteria group bacterium]
MPKALTFLTLLVFTCLIIPTKTFALNAKGRWNIAGESQAGSIKFSFPPKGGSVSGGEFSGGGGGGKYSIQYGGRFKGNFSGGWSGRLSGTFSGWVSISYYDPSIEDTVMKNEDIYGDWSGNISADGSGTAYFKNNAPGGLSGSANFTFSKSAFEREYGEKLIKDEAEKAVEQYGEQEMEKEKEEEKEAEGVMEEAKSSLDPEDYKDWEDVYLEARKLEREARRREWFRDRWACSPTDPNYLRYSKLSDDEAPNVWERGMFVVIEKTEEVNDKVTIGAIKVLNAIEEEFLKAFAPKEPT